MPIGDLDAEPGGEAVERIAGEIRRGDFGEQPRVERARARPGRPARSHSRLSTARSKPTVCPITTAPPRSWKAPARRRRRAAHPRPSRRRCRGCASAGAGIGSPRAAPADEMQRLASSRPPTIRTAAISTIRALRGSSPVVSVSMTTASSASSGVALLPVPPSAHPSRWRSFDASLFGTCPRAQHRQHGACVHALASIRRGCCTASP